MARLGVVGPVCANAGQSFIGWDLAEQLRQHGRVTHAVIGHFDGPNLQRVRINTQVHLAPLAPVDPLASSLATGWGIPLQWGCFVQQSLRILFCRFPMCLPLKCTLAGLGHTQGLHIR
jgi:hypothetical protein